MTHVLVVDDDPAIRTMLAEALGAEGYAVRLSSDGFSALNQVRVAERVRARAPDAALVVVALRTPYDLLRMPWVGTFVCAYTSVEPSVVALAEVLFGETPAAGHLPVKLE
jgi:CheY-like chemotaxis protein